MSNPIQASINLLHFASGASVSGGKRRDAVESSFGSNVINITTTPEAVPTSDIKTVRYLALKCFEGDDIFVSIDGGVTYPIRLSPDEDVTLIRFDFESNRETVTFTCEADTAGSLSGDYVKLQDSVGEVWAWFNYTDTVTGVAEVSTVTAVADSSRSLDAKYFVLGDTGGTVGVILQVNAEKATASITYGVPANTDTVIVNGTTLTKVAAAPAAFEFTSIAELEVLVEAIAGIDSTEDGTTVAMTAATAGTAGNALTLALGGGNTGTMAISGATFTGGVDVAASPSTGATRNLATVTFDKNATAATVASAIQAVIDADAQFVASVLTNVLTITDVATGVRTDVSAGTSTFTAVTTTQGVTEIPPSTPPTPTTERLIQVDYLRNATAIEVAVALAAALEADLEFIVAVPTTAVVTVLSQHAGVRTIATVGTTGWATTPTEDGNGAEYFDVMVKSVGTSKAIIGASPN